MFIIFCVFIALLSIGLGQDCAPCHCDISEMEVDCRNNNRFLNNVPENVIKNAQMIKFKKIDFSGQLFTHLANKQLIHFSQIEHITFKRNKINSLEPDTFQNLFFLRIIDLSKNEITTLPQSLFSNLPNLTFISLNNNKITFLQSYLFKDLPKLKEVHLNKNEINHVQTNCFVNSPSMNTIDLSNNVLQQLKMNIIDNVTSIEYFYFDQNPWFCDAELCPLIKTALNLKWLHGRIPNCYSESNNSKTDRNWEDILILKTLNINVSSDIVEIHEFDDLYLKCQVTSCSNAVILKFNTNSSDRNIPKEYNIINNGNNNEIVLYLNNVTKADEGVYSCLITNCDFCDKKEVILKVLDKKLTEEEKCAKIVEKSEKNKKEDTTVSMSTYIISVITISMTLGLSCGCFIPLFEDVWSLKCLRKWWNKRRNKRINVKKQEEEELNPL